MISQLSVWFNLRYIFLLFASYSNPYIFWVYIVVACVCIYRTTKGVASSDNLKIYYFFLTYVLWRYVEARLSLLSLGLNQ